MQKQGSASASLHMDMTFKQRLRAIIGKVLSFCLRDLAFALHLRPSYQNERLQNVIHPQSFCLRALFRRRALFHAAFLRTSSGVLICPLYKNNYTRPAHIVQEKSIQNINQKTQPPAPFSVLIKQSGNSPTRLYHCIAALARLFPFWLTSAQSWFTICKKGVVLYSTKNRAYHSAPVG